MKTADRISAGVLIGICIYFQVKMDKFNPFSRLFPQVIVIILAGLAFLLFVASFVRPKETAVFGKIPITSCPFCRSW